MLSPFNLLLITSGFSIVMLFVLASLLRSGIAGIREWTTANILAAVALILYACRDVIPDLLSIDLANVLSGLAACILFLGFRRFFGLTTSRAPMAISLATLTLLILTFHYGYNSIAARTVIISAFFGVLCLAISITIFRHAWHAPSPYPYRFTATVAALFAIGQWSRSVVYWTGADHLTSTMQGSNWNLLFLSLGTLMLPIFTMGAIMMVHDRMMSKAIEDANHDFLTGAWSRRAFFEFATRELTRARRMQRSLSLLVFDVDHFKRINDTHGHAAGDRVLVEIVARAELEIRSMDYIARMGGEEFAVLLPEVDAAAAIAVAERLRIRLGTQTAADPATIAAVPYTVSVGVATHDGRETMAELMHRADMALYAAKSGGRNIVVSADAPETQPLTADV